MKRKRHESCSAEQPGPKVAYIDCLRQSHVEEAIEYAVEMGATIINMTVDRETDAWVGRRGVQNVSSILKAAWGGQFSFHRAGAVMSLFATTQGGRNVYHAPISQRC